ncbi:ABC transporter substrate-binding protein [Sphaerimonospora thailandensis]|uniref:ABC transporter substrate-binding protein n=1 Tax=Sphaerimonospora thailandensis TaxID=795644 RepID=A0A8J3R666_9ACTN|nr:ABC transporter substrate-binding protein [Sphaerimonospora thailandensis]GIH68082.1 ABC transporter substrate-binding protein [Sphaerimonospora thailandensis]
MKRNSRLRRRRGAIALCAALATATLLAGCGGASSSSTAATGSGGDTVDGNATLDIGMPVPQSLDPRQAPEPTQLTIGTWPVYDRLLQVGPNAQYEPMLATKWEFSPDGTTLTLTLRQGVTFSDGAPFDAEAVKANLEFSQKADKTAVQAYLADVAGVKVVSADTVELQLKKASTTVLSALASTLGGIMISPKALNNPDLATHPVGTGAYVIESFKPGQSVVYKRRTDEGGIWDPKTGKPAEVTITAYSSLEAMDNAVKSGQADIVTWEGHKQPYQAQLDSGRLQTQPLSQALNMVGLNIKPSVKPYDDVKVRQAINHAINRQAIVDALQPVTTPRVQPWPEQLPGFDAARESAYAYDPDKAKQLLAEAGHPDGFDGGEMLVAQTGALPAVAQAVQADLAAVGIKIQLRSLDVYAMVTGWAKAPNPIQLMYMTLPSIDPYSWLQRLFVNPIYRPTGADPELVKLIEGVDDPSLTDEQRAAKVGEAISYATDNALYAPLLQGIGGYVADGKVRGLDDFASVNGGVADFRNTYLVK